MPGTVRELDCRVFFNGSELSNVLSFRWSLGYDLAVGEASVTLPVRPSGGTYYDDISIVVDGDVRWSGLLFQWDYSLYPRAVTATCRGRLERARQFKLPGAYSAEDKGLQLVDLTGGPATDQDIVQAVLDHVGLDTNGGTIGGTGTVLGTVAPEEFIWRSTESALDYIQRIDSISLGYRTFESAGGQIYRAQVSSRPAGSPDFTFTEGVDIREGSSSRTVQDACNAVRIGGYSVGDFADPRVWYEAEDNDFQSASNPRVFSWDNAMIERRAESSPGQGMSCEAVAGYWLGELNREVVKLTLTTPRSDVMGPGQIHLVQGPGGTADRLGAGELLWVQRNDGQRELSGAFSQTNAYIGGGG